MLELIAPILLVISIFLIFRSLVLWYWNLGKIESHLAKILEILNKKTDDIKEVNHRIFGEYFIVIKHKEKVNIFHVEEYLHETCFNCILEQSMDIYIKKAPFELTREEIRETLKNQYQEVFILNTLLEAKQKHKELDI
jgi:hypothetical protein